MEQPEQKSRELFINELAVLRQQLLDLEEQVVNFDLIGDTREKEESVAIVSNQISLRLQDVLETTSEAAIAVNSQGRIIMANEKAEGLFGYDQQDFIDQPVELLIPDRFHGRHVEHRHTYIAEPRIRPMGERLDLVGRRSDGTEIPLRIGLSYIKNNDDVLAIALITEAIVLEDQDAYAEILYPTLIPTQWGSVQI